MKKKTTILNRFLLCSSLLMLVACGGESTQKTGCDELDTSSAECNLTQEQKDEAARKAEERRQISNARRRKMLVENQSVSIADLSDTNLSLRLGVKLNGRLRPVIYSVRIDKSLAEQYDLQDKTNEIQNILPNHNLEVSSFRFKAGKVDVIAFEYRFLRYTEIANESASQFVLMILNKDLGSKAIVKNHFEFPTRSDLRIWAKSTSEKDVEKP